MCSQNVSLTGKDGGILISKVTINLLLTEAANATVITSGQMWISDGVYSPYIDVAVCFYVLKLSAAPLLGTLGWDREIPKVIKMLVRNEVCDLWNFTLRRNPKRAHILFTWRRKTEITTPNCLLSRAPQIYLAVHD